MPHSKAAAIVLTAMVSIFCLPLVGAKAQTLLASSLGTNLASVNYFTPEQPFLNILKTGAGWSGTATSGTRYEQSQNVFDLDANEYPKSMNGTGVAAGQTFTEIDTLVLRGLATNSGPFYPAGQYIVLFDGAGTIAYDFDAVKNSSLSTPGRDVLDVNTPSTDGIRIRITATDPTHSGNYIRNIRLVYAPNEAQLGSGEIFNPDFINRISKFKTLRFMDWMQTVVNVQTNWSDRAVPNQAFWGKDSSISGSRGGVPIEVMVALCNKIGADGWFNMPLLSNDDYVTHFATLVHSTLNSSLKAYVEYGNELWNMWLGNPAFAGLITPAHATFPGLSDDWSAVFQYGILRAVQNGSTWKSVWGGDSARVIRIAAGQNGYVDRNRYILDAVATDGGGSASLYTGHVSANVDAFAVAPYFGDVYSVPDTFTLDQLFTEIMSGGLVSGGYPGGMIKQSLDWVAANYSIVSTRGLPLVAYEGGQSLVNASHTDAALQNLYAAANRDSRMGGALTTLLNGWKLAGGTLFNHYLDIGLSSQFGYWGALENVLQTSSPKFDALMNYISTTTPTMTTTTPTTTTPTTTTPATTTPTTTTPTTTTPTTTTPTTTTPATTTPTTTTPTTTPSTTTATMVPAVTLTSPANGAVYKNNGAVNITVSATDPQGITSITIMGDSQTLVTCPSTTNCSTSWQGKKISRGTHTIGATAVNNLGLPSSTSITITELK